MSNTRTSARILCLWFLACGGETAHATTEILALSGDSAPGGGTILGFGVAPALNNLGEATFYITVDDNSDQVPDAAAIVRGETSALTTVVRTGGNAPGNSGTNGQFFDFSAPAINDRGQIAFGAQLVNTNGGTNDNTAVFRTNGGSVIQITRKGNMVPGSPATLGEFVPPIVLNEMGRAGFYANLLGTLGTSSDEGIYYGAGTTITEIVREGDSVPGGGSFDEFGPAVINDRGQFAFAAGLDSPDTSGIFRADSQFIANVVRRGDPVPGSNDQFAVFSSTVSPAINNDGNVAFWSAFDQAENNEGIFRYASGGALTEIVRTGDSAPGGNGEFNNLGHPNLNDDLQVAFLSTLSDTDGGSADDTGVFLGGGGSITEIVREGAQSPDGNGVIADVRDTEVAAINNSGQVAFISPLRNTAGGTFDNAAIFVGDGTRLTTVVRKGDVVDGSPIVDADFTFSPSSHLSGLGSFNDAGQLAYIFALADGRQGMALWTPSLSVLGDYDGNGTVGPEDYNVWQATFGSTSFLDADGNGNNVVDAADYTIWRDNLGTGSSSTTNFTIVPESSAGVLAVYAAICALCPRSSRQCGSFVRG